MPEVYSQLSLFATIEPLTMRKKRKKFPKPQPGYKFCNACEIEKSIEEFRTVKGKPISECILCARTRDRARNPIRKPRKTPIKPKPTKPDHKVCNTCFKEKPLTDFKHVSIQKDGHAGRCKDCERDLREARPEEEKERIKTQKRAYYAENREQIQTHDRIRTRTIHHKQIRNARQRAKYAEQAEQRRIKRLSKPKKYSDVLPITAKICPKCNPPVEKPLSDFPQRKGRRDGHSTYCNECTKKHNRQYHGSETAKAKRRAREAAKGEDHKKAKYIAHKEWRQKHIEEIRERDRIKYATDPEYAKRVRHHALRWIKNHPLEMQEHQMRRIARIKNTTVEPVDLRKILDRYGRWCYICEQEILPTQSLVFDHVIPLIPRSGNPQGTHTEENIRPAHRECNGRKSNRRFEDLTPFDRRGVL